MRTRIGVLCGCCAVLCLATTLLLGRTGVVKTRDGQTIEGEITEQAQTITVTRRRIPIVISRGDVESIEYPTGTVQEQFDKRLGSLDDKDVAGRIALARWAFDQDQYLLSRQALESALTIEPTNREASALLENVRMQIRLERTKKAGDERKPVTSPTTASATTGPTGPQALPDPRHLLTLDDINAIRQFELKPTDTFVRINFAKDVKKRFAQAQNIRVQDFNALEPFDQLQEILRKGTPDMQRDVRIVSDPPSILEYRRYVQPLVLSSCATTGCHGAAGAGGLMLFNPADNEAVTYTNFYLLNTYATKAGEAQGPFGAGERRVIDRLQPQQSLLLQYGLPANIAEHDHPKVNGHRVVFRNRDDIAYRRLSDWITSSLRAIKPEYPVTYTPPPPTGRAVTPPPRVREAEPPPATTEPTTAPARGATTRPAQ